MCVHHTKAVTCKGCQTVEPIDISEELCSTVNNDPEKKLGFGGCGQTTNMTTNVRETICGSCTNASNAALKAGDKRDKDKAVETSMSAMDWYGRGLGDQY